MMLVWSAIPARGLAAMIVRYFKVGKHYVKLYLMLDFLCEIRVLFVPWHVTAIAIPCLGVITLWSGSPPPRDGVSF